jgi:nicotinate-nucleotide adenylyltransferase
MNILLFGGSFNPPHLGHLLVIQQALELIPHVGELWLLPTTTNPIISKHEAPATIRLELCHHLVSDLNLPQVKVSSFEIDNPSDGSTHTTLQKLKAAYPQHTFSFLMGSDQLPVFTQWNNWEQLLDEMKFYVYPRAGYSMTPLYRNMVPLNSDTQVITNISSTLIRKRAAQHLSVTHLLTPTILKLYTHL